MIFILTQSFEYDSAQVCEWLAHKREIFKRWNLDDSNFKTLDDFSFKEQILGLWFRKFSSSKLSFLSEKVPKLLKKSLHKHLKAELFRLKQSYYQNIQAKNILGKLDYSYYNKITLIETAACLNISTPETLITSSKQELLDFKAGKQAIITKCLSDGSFFSINGKNYAHYTSEVADALIAELPDTFFPSLFQEKIEKAYELRVFYLDAKCYSMAIFSQRNQQTAIDFRRYDTQKPNRTVPYQLPQGLEDKIHQLMQTLDLNTGSLDFIRSIEGEYVFLEVNPAGQFGMVSNPCNYYLEKKVAEFLSQ